MADRQGSYVMKLAVDGNDNVRVAISGLTEGYQTLAKAVSMANAKLKDQNNAHKGTANFYKEQINYLKDLRDRLAKTSSETSKYNSIIDRLSKKKAALSAPMKGTLEAYRQEVKELRNLQATVARTPAAYDAYEKKIASVKTNVEKLTKSQSMQIKTNKDMISNAGLGGATLTELGRTVSDANYGFTAMANNLSQLSTLFMTFVSKTEGGLKPALGNLWKQLNGPLGIVLALQVAIAMFEKFSMTSRDAAKETKSASEEVYASSVVLNNYVDTLNDVNTSEQERIRITKILIDEVPDLKKEDFDYGENLKNVTRIIKEYTLSQASRLEVDKLVSDNSKILAQRSRAQAIQQIEDETERLEAIKKFMIDSEKSLVRTSRLTGLAGAVQTTVKLTDQEIINNFKVFASQIDKESDPILDKINEISRGIKISDSDRGPSQLALSNILRDLQDEYDIFMAERFDKERLASANELRDTKEGLAQSVKEKAISQEKANASIEIAEKLHSERMKAIDKSEYDYYVDRIQKQADEYGKFLSDVAKARDKESKENIQSIIDDGLKVSNERKKEALDTISDKKKLKDKFREIDIDILESQVELIQMAISVSSIGAIEGLKIIDKFQAKIVSLKAGGSESEEEKDMTAKEKADRAVQAINLLTNALGDALQMEIEAEMSKEERKTAIRNNALKERLNSENLDAKQREAINNRIAANEAKLEQKREKLAEKSFKLQKAMSIANALINTYEMANKAFNSLAVIPFVGPTLGKAAAVAAVGLGLAQVNAIRKTQFVPSGTSVASDSSVGSAQVQAPNFNIVGQSGSNQLAQSIQGQLDKPIRAYVVSKDVSTAQEMDRNIVKTAGI